MTGWRRQIRVSSAFPRTCAALRALATAAAITIALAALLAASPLLDRAMAAMPSSVRAAFPAFAIAYAVALALAGMLMAWSARRKQLWTGAAALALPVAALPFLSAPLMTAIAEASSSASLARAIERAAPGAQVIGVSIYPTSLRYYLDRPVLVTTNDGAELTSNYVASRYAELREHPGTPLRGWYWWYFALDACAEPTVFVIEAAKPEAAYLAARLPRIATGGPGGKLAAYGPCTPARPGEPR